MKNMFLLRFVSLATAALVIAAPNALCQSAANADELAKLKSENEKLRAESQRLRQLITQGQSAPAAPAVVPAKAPLAPPPAAPAAAQAPAATPSPVPAGLTHWLTSSSDKRHNSKCRWFGTSKGKACTATEGDPCLKCGG